jgi:16S rRNA processing protein RimM
MPERENMVCIGAIAGAHGVRGLVRVRSFTERPESVAAYGPLADDRGRRFTLTVRGPAKGGVIAALSGVEDREAAEALRGQRLWAPRAALPPAAEDEFYYADLIGLAAVSEDGRPLGEVAAVLEPGPVPVLEIRGADGDSRFVPFSREAVPDIDLAAGRLTVAALPGLLDG